MTLDITVIGPDGTPYHFATPRHTLGPNAALGGSTEAAITITGNYRSLYGARGLHLTDLDGMSPDAALRRLGPVLVDWPYEAPAEDYYMATSGNARAALQDLYDLIYQTGLTAQGHVDVT